MGVKFTSLSEATAAESASEMSICCRQPRELIKLGRRGKPRGEVCGKMSSGLGPIRRLVSVVSLDRDSIDSVAAYTLGWLQRRTRERSFEAWRDHRGCSSKKGSWVMA